MTGETAKPTCAKNAQVQTAPAEMPGVEEIARALAIFFANNRQPCMSGDPRDRLSPLRRRDLDDAARAVLDLFAPILAEKERLVSYWLYQHDQGQEEIRQLSDNLAFAEYETKTLEARALAAEAALAAERERAADIADMAAEREDARAFENDDDLHVAECRGAERAAKAIAAAIRARGE